MADGKPCSTGRTFSSDGLAPRFSGQRKRCRVLIVDDVEDNRDLYSTYFEYVGFSTEQACDGAEALEKMSAEPFDIVIMDLSMPNLDGWEATRRIKANPKTRHVIVIVVSGHTTEANLRAAREAGADEVCSKPCMPRELLRLVQRYLDGAQRETSGGPPSSSRAPASVRSIAGAKRGQSR